MLTSVEVCAGAGGQAVGLEQAGFQHLALVEIDHHACLTLKHNRPSWNVISGDITSESVHRLARTEWKGIDLLSGGVPCPPFSVAGKQLGHKDERDLFPSMVKLVRECDPRAVLIENVRGLLSPVFDTYRDRITGQLSNLGYHVVGWRLLNASDFGVPQLRPRVVMVAMKRELANRFHWPEPIGIPAPTVGDALYEEISSRGWRGARAWKAHANGIAPTLVGGSRKHGGPDLGPTRARAAWERLGVDGRTLAEEPPDEEHLGPPRLTVKMAALIQGFPKDWDILGRKTPAYRQVGNAFPPPVARAVGKAVAHAISVENRPAKLPDIQMTPSSSAR